jgi:hypothetical protein
MDTSGDLGVRGGQRRGNLDLAGRGDSDLKC